MQARRHVAVPNANENKTQQSIIITRHHIHNDTFDMVDNTVTTELFLSRGYSTTR